MVRAATTWAGKKLQRIKDMAARPQFWAWLGLAVFASWLRLRHLGYTEIWHDQARTLNMALQWVHGGPFPLASELSTLGTHNAPLVLYLYALALAIAPNMFSVVWLIALMNLAAVFIVGAATSRVFGWRAGWWAALLFAVAPWAVYYGRLIWMQSFVPAFAAGLYACVLLYFTVDPRPRYLIAGPLFLAAAIQTHPTALSLLPPLLVAGLVLRRKLQWKPLLVGVALAAASFAPFVVFQIQSRFADFAVAQRGLEGHLDVNLTSLRWVLDLFGSRTVFSTMGNVGKQWSTLVPAMPYADRLMEAWLWLGFGGAALSGLKLCRKHSPPAAAGLIMVLWISLPILQYIPHTRLLFNYYFLYLLPVGTVLMASFSERLAGWLSGLVSHWPRLTPAAAGLAFAPLAFVAASYAQVSIVGQDLLVAGVFGEQRIVDTQAAIDTARRLLAARPKSDLVVINEVPLWADSRLGLLREFVDCRRVMFADRELYLYPEPSAVYLMPVKDATRADWLNANAVLLSEATIRTPQETWTFYDLPADRRAAALPAGLSGPPLATWANGLMLRSFSMEGQLSGQAGLQLAYVWEVGANVPGELARAAQSLRFTNQLLSADGRLMAQFDGVASDSRDWHPGDVIQRTWWLPIPPDLPPGAYRLATAIYSIPDVRRVPLADGSGDLLYLRELAR